MHFSLLGSGSSGNALLALSPTSSLLVDCGLSLKQLRLRMALLGCDPKNLSAVFVTHEHSDHVAGLGVLARKCGVRSYMTDGTFEGLPSRVGVIPNHRFLLSGTWVNMRDFMVGSYAINHDAADPVGYVVECGKAKLGIATDLGSASALVRARLKGCNALVVEANYDRDLLMKSDYPLHLRQRIRSGTGHLSNSQMTSLLRSLVYPGLELVVATHVSSENNTEELVRAAVSEGLDGHECRVEVATQDKPTELFEVAG